MKRFVVVTIFCLVTVVLQAQAGQTLTMTQNQTSRAAIIVLDANGNTVPAADYTISATFSDSSVASYSPGSFLINALKVGSTTVTWTVNAVTSTGWVGSATIGPDTVTVVPKTISSATVSYSTPGP